MSDSNQESPIIIRDIEGVSELRAVETLQKEVWGCADLDVAPLTMFVATREVGAVLIGAYYGSELVGFVYGFPGYEHGHATHHSHMLAVLPAYRNHRLGVKLKLAQRERVLAQGINRITWTFDPLQSLNAYFNFAKLGVVADSYKINFYGEATSSFLHQIGTDRLWVSWLLNSERVRSRLQPAGQQSLVSAVEASELLVVDSDNAPRQNIPSQISCHERLAIEIPGDINDLQRRTGALAIAWREATRWAFTEAMMGGYLVDEFHRLTRSGQSIGRYLLSHG